MNEEASLYLVRLLFSFLEMKCIRWSMYTHLILKIAYQNCFCAKSYCMGALKC